ncbi:MAG: hypothetical protein M1840_000573 [Geoglossum simile]|nr:MAG: hypothetical protein M1840_000573 [Geoglossum simile]
MHKSVVRLFFKVSDGIARELLQGVEEFVQEWYKVENVDARGTDEAIGNPAEVIESEEVKGNAAVLSAIVSKGFDAKPIVSVTFEGQLILPYWLSTIELAFSTPPVINTWLQTMAINYIQGDIPHLDEDSMDKLLGAWRFSDHFPDVYDQPTYQDLDAIFSSNSDIDIYTDGHNQTETKISPDNEILLDELFRKDDSINEAYPNDLKENGENIEEGATLSQDNLELGNLWPEACCCCSEIANVKKQVRTILTSTP